jgi:hypothetical protein
LLYKDIFDIFFSSSEKNMKKNGVGGTVLWGSTNEQANPASDVITSMLDPFDKNPMMGICIFFSCAWRANMMASLELALRKDTRRDAQAPVPCSAVGVAMRELVAARELSKFPRVVTALCFIL